MKEWTGPFKVLGIAETDTTIDIGNGPVTFRNTHIKSYHCHTEEIDINYPQTTNDIAQKPKDEFANEEIPTPLDHQKPQRPCQPGRSPKSYWTKNLMDEMTDIFISYRKRANYKLALKLRHDRIITTTGNLLEKSNLTEIEFLLANGVI